MCADLWQNYFKFVRISVFWLAGCVVWGEKWARMCAKMLLMGVCERVFRTKSLPLHPIF